VLFNPEYDLVAFGDAERFPDFFGDRSSAKCRVTRVGSPRKVRGVRLSGPACCARHFRAANATVGRIV
jgi:hypothetical protein